MRSDDLDFRLPPELIAQVPPSDRSSAKLLHYRSEDQSIAHRQFSDLPSLLGPGDLLVFNDSKVIPARFTLQKDTGGKIEGLFIDIEPEGAWRVLLRNPGKFEGSVSLRFADEPDLEAVVSRHPAEGEYRMQVKSGDPAPAILSRIGRMPLPPYIKRGKDHDPLDDLDRQRYQTVYAANEGSIAAPTAGLHFTAEILAQLDAKGIRRAFVTLHVGLGTFKPIAADELNDHAMHSESYTLSSSTADAINLAKQESRRVISVGTTAARVLESQPPGNLRAASGQTRIFIYPPYIWKHVDALITNFHLPRSTLIALVAARVGLDAQRRIYREAIENRYRFFSYGDSSLLE